jgi:hypothetical protein
MISSRTDGAQTPPRRKDDVAGLVLRRPQDRLVRGIAELHEIVATTPWNWVKNCRDFVPSPSLLKAIASNLSFVYAAFLVFSWRRIERKRFTAPTLILARGMSQASR